MTNIFSARCAWCSAWDRRAPALGRWRRGTTAGVDKSVELSLSATKKQKAIKNKALVVEASCAAEACTVVASASVNVPGASAAKKFKLKTVTKTLAAGQKVKLKVKLSTKALKAARRARGRGKKITAKVSVAATDAAKNTTTRTASVTVSG